MLDYQTLVAVNRRWEREPNEGFRAYLETEMRKALPPAPPVVVEPPGAPTPQEWADDAWAKFLVAWVDYNLGKGHTDRAWNEFLEENPAPAAPPEIQVTRAQMAETPLEATIEDGVLVVRIGVNTLAQAAACSDWANPFNEAADEYQRTFVITDAQVFATEVERALLDEREDGSSLLTDVLDKASSNAVDDGAEGCEFDDCVVPHGQHDPRETWAVLTVPSGTEAALAAPVVPTSGERPELAVGDVVCVDWFSHPLLVTKANITPYLANIEGVCAIYRTPLWQRDTSTRGGKA